jgi:carbonic anhydrase
MHSRRNFFGGAVGLGSALGVLAASGTRAEAQEACRVFTKDTQGATSPAAAVQMLKEGNERFLTGKMVNCDLMTQVRATASGQAPIACVVGCIDSRVPPEMVFDQRLGSIFSPRIAGNFVNTDILGSLEFACKVAGAKAIVVLGHSECGAIKGAIDQAKLGNLTKMLANFEPAVAAAKIKGERSSKDKKVVQTVADENVKIAVKNITQKSAVLKEMVAKKQLVVVGAMHDVSTGKIVFFTPVA